MAQDWIKAIPVKSFDTSTLSGSYQVVNPGGLPHACIKMRIFNNSTAVVTVSFDGVTDNEILPSGYLWQSPGQEDAPPNAKFALWRAGQQIWVKSSVAEAGSLTVSGYYV